MRRVVFVIPSGPVMCCSISSASDWPGAPPPGARERVGVDAVLVDGSGIADERRLERLVAAGQDVRHAGDLLVAVDVLVPEPVRQPGRVAHELADRRLAVRGPQARRVAVEALE